MTERKCWIGLVVLVVICFAAAGLGALVTTPQIPNWYADLAKPTWTPPDWIFGSDLMNRGGGFFLNFTTRSQPTSPSCRTSP